MNKEQVVILAVSQYDFTTKEGKNLKGTTVFYYPASDFDAFIDADGTLGRKPMKASMPEEFYEQCKNVGIPCSAMVDYTMRSYQGQMMLKASSFELMPGV